MVWAKGDDKDSTWMLQVHPEFHTFQQRFCAIFSSNRIVCELYNSMVKRKRQKSERNWGEMGGK